MARIEYTGQLRLRLGRDGDDVAAGQSIAAAVGQAVADAEPAIRQFLLRDDGSLQPTIVPFVNDQQAKGTALLAEADRVTLLTPIAGG